MSYVPFYPRRGHGVSAAEGGNSHALRGRKVASTGCAAVSAEGLPSADGKEKEGAPSFESARQVNR